MRNTTAHKVDLICFWENLDEERIRDVEAKWAAESEDRIDAVVRGELPTVDGSPAIRDLRWKL